VIDVDSLPGLAGSVDEALRRAQGARRRAFDALGDVDAMRVLDDAAAIAEAEDLAVLAAREEVRAQCLLDEQARYRFQGVGRQQKATAAAVEQAAVAIAGLMLETATRLAGRTIEILYSAQPVELGEAPSTGELDELFRDRLQLLGRVNRGEVVVLALPAMPPARSEERAA
jgi:hypothetical protein